MYAPHKFIDAQVELSQPSQAPQRRWNHPTQAVTLAVELSKLGQVRDGIWNRTAEIILTQVNDFELSETSNPIRYPTLRNNTSGV
jgi:hypothetical protein